MDWRDLLKKHEPTHQLTAQQLREVLEALDKSIAVKMHSESEWEDQWAREGKEKG